MPEIAQTLHRFVDLPGALLKVVIVSGRHAQKFDALIAQLGNGADDIVRGERDVLHAGSPIIFEVLFNLRIAPPRGRLVDGKLDAAVAVGHDFRHQGGVFGTDVLIVKVLIETKAHGVAIEIDPAGFISPQPTLPTM